MDSMINNTTSFVWTEMMAEVDRQNNKYCYTPLNGVYSIKPKDTTGIVREYFENDLINGSDRFLVNVWDVCDDYYCYEIIMKTTDPKEIFNYIESLTISVIKQNFSGPAVMTLR